jgi:hypothetical protein
MKREGANDTCATADAGRMAEKGGARSRHNSLGGMSLRPLDGEETIGGERGSKKGKKIRCRKREGRRREGRRGEDWFGGVTSNTR